MIEPGDGDERAILLGWLRFHRDALAAACADRIEPSLILLVRQACEAERTYATWALGPSEPLQPVWDANSDPDPDVDCAVDAAGTLAAWRRERDAADLRISAHDDLDAVGGGNGRTVRWSLMKLVNEYARLGGRLREGPDGLS